MDDTIWTTPNHFPGNSSLPTEQPFVEVTTSSVHDKALEDGKGNGSPMNNSRSSAGAGAEVSYENKVHDLSVRGASTKSSFLSDDETLNEGTTSRQSNRIDIKDWSQTGRGSHVDFKHEETVPLEQGRWLGRGATGDVYETTVQGWQLAHKKVIIKRKLVDKEKREIEILRRITHVHIIQLIGTYTHRQFLGMLIYPVAVCDMHTFFEDVEAWSLSRANPDTRENRLEALDSIHKARLIAIGYNFPGPGSRFNASPVYSKMGCLLSAIAYLHNQKIRHKDLKPSNILLSPDNLWLSDFGSATDFSLLSQSATDNERGTARYFSPEVATWKPSGRAADIFSLGCVLLEIVVLHDRGTLEHIRLNRSSDPSFHANLDRMETWCTTVKERNSSTEYHVLQEVKLMLKKESDARPTAQELLIRITGYDLADTSQTSQAVFGECCASTFLPNRQRREETTSSKEKVRELELELQKVKQSRDQNQDEVIELCQLRASSERKFQRWFYEYRQEQERMQEREAELLGSLEAERKARAEAEASLQRMATEKGDAERERRAQTRATGGPVIGGQVQADRFNIRTPQQIMKARRRRADEEAQRKAEEGRRRSPRLDDSSARAYNESIRLLKRQEPANTINIDRSSSFVPEESPLSSLTRKLDDLSKEERRARILEAELAAQEKSEAEMRRVRKLEAELAAQEKSEAEMRRVRKLEAELAAQEKSKAELHIYDPEISGLSRSSPASSSVLLPPTSEVSYNGPTIVISEETRSRLSKNLSQDRISMRVSEKLQQQQQSVEGASSNSMKNTTEEDLTSLHKPRRRRRKDGWAEAPEISKIYRRTSRDGKEARPINDTEPSFHPSGAADHPARSSVSGASSINNPKLLKAVEYGMKKISLPELGALKEENRTARNPDKFKRLSHINIRDSKISDEVMDDNTRLLDKKSFDESTFGRPTPQSFKETQNLSRKRELGMVDRPSKGASTEPVARPSKLDFIREWARDKGTTFTKTDKN